MLTRTDWNGCRTVGRGAGGGGGRARGWEGVRERVRKGKWRVRIREEEVRQTIASPQMIREVTCSAVRSWCEC